MKKLAISKIYTKKTLATAAKNTTINSLPKETSLFTLIETL